MADAMDAASFSAHLNALEPVERALIINVYDRLRTEYPGKSDEEMLELTAEWTGCLHEVYRRTGSFGFQAANQISVVAKTLPACCVSATRGKLAQDLCEDGVGTDGRQLFEVHPRGKPYKRGEKTLIMNLFSQLRHRHRDKSETEIARMTSALTGCSIRAAFKIRTEFRKFGGPLPTANMQRPGAVGKRVRLALYDEFVFSAIRRKVHDFYRRDEEPISEKICAEINADPALPNFKPRSLRHLLGDLGFQSTIRSRKSRFVERDEIILRRRRYLRQIQKHRREGRTIHYLDEMWVPAGHPSANGTKQPLPRDGSVVVVHAGNERGFVDGALLVFRAEKTADAQEEMDGPRFEEWFRTQLVPNVKPGSVVVMDSAPYHWVEAEPVPTAATRKVEVQEWLTDRGVSWSRDMIKRELLALVAKVKTRDARHSSDDDAVRNGLTVLRLPPFHCELNAMESVWSAVKDYVAKEGKTFEMREIEQLTKEALATVTPERWSECVSRVIEEEQRLWEVDELDDLQVENRAFCRWSMEHPEESGDNDGGSEFEEI